jgi:hypothetical protein
VIERWKKMMADPARVPIYRAIDIERDRQDAQHGAQQDLPVLREGERLLDPENVMRARYERRKRAGTLSHGDIILEELAEAFDAPDYSSMREELVQAAACIVKAIEALDWQQTRTYDP